ncbi:high mobility group protein B1-like [Montipora capricornis]|uniref:high mobility group protein B1-like n=1 Tax=Montipora foliosa TaxID=591990 RepID=UPI0035F1EC32
MEGAKSKKRAAEQSLHKSKSPKKAKTGKEGRSSKKAKKDGPQVKRASSAYIHFTTDFRKKLKEKCEKNGDPLPKANEVAKMAGEQWKKLTPDERGPYDQKAREDKERYMRECGKFEKKESDKPKRAPTAYFIFLAEFREQMKGKQSEGDQKIPALAGEKWRTMGEKEKEKYKQLEAAAKKKHEVAMEEWRKKNADKEPEKPVKAKPAPKKAPPKKTAPKVIDSEDDEDDDDEDDDDEEEEEEEADDADDDAGDDDDDDEDDDDDDDDDE